MSVPSRRSASATVALVGLTPATRTVGAVEAGKNASRACPPTSTRPRRAATAKAGRAVRQDTPCSHRWFAAVAVTPMRNEIAYGPAADSTWSSARFACCVTASSP